MKEDNECVNVNPSVPPNSSDDVEKGVFTILNLLHPLRDGGKRQEFNNVAENLRLKNQENLTLKILITLEQSVVESYHNKIEKAEEMVNEALEILEKSKVKAKDATSYLYLITMAHIHLTGFYRRQNKHGKAEEAINIGYQNSTGLNSHFLKALIFYEKASNSTKYISSIPNGPARNEHFASAKDLMKQCITVCTDLDNNGGIYIRKHHFCFLKLALMALNCRTQAARGQIPSAECIEDATNCLKEVDEKYAAQISEGQQIQFLIAKADLSFRQQNYQVAQGNYKHALALAEICGFKLEISGIEDRLADIATLIDEKESMDLEIHFSEEGHPDSLSSSTIIIDIFELSGFTARLCMNIKYFILHCVFCLSVPKWLKSFFTTTDLLTSCNIMFGLFRKDMPLLNHIMLLGKQVMYYSRHLNIKPSISIS